jgi:hypothetical protein
MESCQLSMGPRFLAPFGAYLPFVHELSSDSPCRAPVPLRIAFCRLVMPGVKYVVQVPRTHGAFWIAFARADPAVAGRLPGRARSRPYRTSMSIRQSS